MKKVEISVENLNKILAYLGTRPYAEVYNLVAMLATEIRKDEIDESPKKEENSTSDGN